ncbi:hypothetical protein KNN17_02140 [Arthrobacter bambusae]|uniref:hypothetical protein n=1 Tax=Arthrobacter TaxID=1663 RepID=UPI001F514901|nr:MULTISPECIES: hypothetical protein [Arthrobacter]MCI0140374.1 hypothetical protein [Arthrobacter bambusae]UYY81751.1 hypothetical protein OIT41_01330 [Arthrobacter sp. YA7-1]
MRRAAKTGIVVAGVVAVGLAGAITLNATQSSSTSIAGAAPSVTVSASASAAGASATPAATPSASASAPAANSAAANTPAGAAPSSQAPAPAPVPAPAGSAKPDAPVPAPAVPAPAPAVPAPVAQGLDAAGVQRIKDSCTARLQSDAAHSAIVTGTVVPRPFTVVSIAFSGNPVQSTAASGLASYDILMKITTKLVDGPAQDSVRVCRVYDSDSHVDWLPAG